MFQAQTRGKHKENSETFKAITFKSDTKKPFRIKIIMTTKFYKEWKLEMQRFLLNMVMDMYAHAEDK